MLHLVSLAKGTLVDAHDADAVREMADRYGLMAGPSTVLRQAQDASSGGESLDDMIAILPAVLDDCRRDTAHADFDDMIWMPLVNNIAVDEFDWVFGDEAQDWTPADIQLVLRAAGSAGHVVAIGDRFQSMYGFRGADVDAISAIIEATNAVTLPLSITYRCPTKHVELAQTIVPHIEARPGAPAGTVSYVDEFNFSSQLRDGDMVICRTNAPLMSYALELIADGVKAVVRGKEIGASLAALARALSVDAPSMAQMYANLSKHEEREQRRLASGGVSETAMSMFQDKVDALAVIMDECAVPGEVTARIKSLFSEDRGSVTFSTVHGAKGLEAERVFILRPDLMPLSRARQAWEQQQERNIEYVAYTRSKNELYFVEEGE
jgi:DNA helicase-2/ATP-dependent DNA helicase PcrA